MSHDDAPDSIPPGSTFAGKYRVEKLLGTGGFGAVYLVTNEVGWNLALKVLHPDLNTGEEYRRRFLQEMNLARQLIHEHAVPVRDAGVADGRIYYTMDFIRGKSMGDVIKDEHKIAPARAVEWMVQVLSFLQFLHGKGYIHRDLKPDNFIVQVEKGKESVRVLDLGIAKSIAADTSLMVTAGGIIIGTPPYMAPEHVAGDPIDHRIDIYASGVILYECLCGKRPFVASTRQQLYNVIRSEPPRSLVEVIPGFPKPLWRAIEKSLSKNRDDRYASAREFATALEALRLPAPVAATEAEMTAATMAHDTPEKTVPSTGGGRRGTKSGSTAAGKRRAVPIAIASAVVLLLVGGVYLYPLMFGSGSEGEAGKGKETELAKKDGALDADPSGGDKNEGTEQANETRSNEQPVVSPTPPVVGPDPKEDEKAPEQKDPPPTGDEPSTKTEEGKAATSNGSAAPTEVPKAGEIKNSPANSPKETTEESKSEESTTTAEKKPAEQRPPPAGCELVPDTGYDPTTGHPLRIRHTSTGIVLVFIPATTANGFLMGGVDSDVLVEKDERPPHSVILSRPYYLGETEVTWTQYRNGATATSLEIHGDLYEKESVPGEPAGEDHPVYRIHWSEADEFCRRSGLSLPTEAQWEWACRYESQATYLWGDVFAEGAGWGNLDEKNPFRDGVRGIAIAKFARPTPKLGLYGLAGNVMEWCSDAYREDTYSMRPLISKDPVNSPPEGTANVRRIARGGHYLGSAKECRISRKQHMPPGPSGKREFTVGFRVCLNLGESSNK